MDRFEFLKDDFPELYTLCQDANNYVDKDASVALTKARQALEKIVEAILQDRGGYVERDLFTNISKLGDFAGDTCSDMHQLRMIANNAVHGTETTEQDAKEGLNILFSIVVWYFVDVRGGKLTEEEIWPSDRERIDHYLPVKSNVGLQKPKVGEFVNPLDIADFDIPRSFKKKDVLEKDIFETQEEYEARIRNLEPVHIGYAVFDPKNVDQLTKTAFFLFYLDSVFANLFCHPFALRHCPRATIFGPLLCP